MAEQRNINIFEGDYRVESLRLVIQGLDNSIAVIKDKLSCGGWYDGLWAQEESEPIYGLAFIAFQNYINSSIKDFAETSANKHEFYKKGQRLEGFEMTDIELIIALANYSKHLDDDGEFHPATKRTLDVFGLNTYKEVFVSESAILNGLDILHENWDLQEITQRVVSWRAELWKNK